MVRSSVTSLCLLSLFVSHQFSADTAHLYAQEDVYQQARQRAKDAAGYKNLQKIGLALHGYHDIFGHFPPSVVSARDGKIPHSWRVELLPILKHYVAGVERDKLHAGIDREEYDQLIKECGYDVNQPWDSKANADALKNMPEVYRHPSQPADATDSAYYAVKGNGTAFDASEVIGYKDYSDPWVGSTLMIVESRARESWTKPVDLLYSEDAVLPRFGGFAEQGALGLTCDGAVHFLSDSIPPDDLRALITRDPEDKFAIPGIPYRFRD